MSPPTRKQTLGHFGEAAAVAALQKQGYRIIEQNWRCSAGEIDIVALHDGELVFAEVRTIRSPGFMSPEESITAAKQARLARLAGLYLEHHPTAMPAGQTWRIDVVAVEVGRDGKLDRLEVIPNAVGG
ncbi:MAG: YraN family protein [Candidatus Marsarchaeota archaeon]|nr:YraN family protein [Candidatus Marsarchaeota archaeon]